MRGSGSLRGAHSPFRPGGTFQSKIDQLSFPLSKSFVEFMFSPLYVFFNQSWRFQQFDVFVPSLHRFVCIACVECAAARAMNVRRRRRKSEAPNPHTCGASSHKLLTPSRVRPCDRRKKKKTELLRIFYSVKLCSAKEKKATRVVPVPGRDGALWSCVVVS